MRIEFAAQSQIDGIWPRVTDYLQSGIDATENDLTLAGLYTACRSGHAFLMVGGIDDAIAMAAVWSFQNWNCGPVFRCLVLGGDDMSRWLPLAFAEAKRVAALGGAKKLVANGRKGWLRAVPNATEIYTAMEVDLSNVRQR